MLYAGFCKGTVKGRAGKSVSTVTLAPGGFEPAARGDLILDSPTMLACSKVPFPTQSRAETTLRKVARRNAAVGKKVPTGTYFCSHCRAWHLTSKSPSQVAPWAK